MSNAGARAKHSIGLNRDSNVWARYVQQRENSRQRMDKKEMTNSEFVGLLLDVYEFHLNDE